MDGLRPLDAPPSWQGWSGAGRVLGFIVAVFGGVVIVAPLVVLMPVAPPIWITPAIPVAIVLLATWAFVRLDDTTLPALGLPFPQGSARPSAWGFLVGALLLMAVFGLIGVSGAFSYVPAEGSVGGYLRFLGLALIFFGLAAALEELLFRGYAFRVLVEVAGVPIAIVFSSLLFALAHGWNPNVAPLGLANIFLAGILLAIAYLRTRSLWFVTALHAGWNWTMAALLDAPVSGLDELDTPLYDLSISGPAWWSGGAFGPEAGVPATLVLGAAALWFWRSPGSSRLGHDVPHMGDEVSRYGREA